MESSAMAYVTLVTNDFYVAGALVLGHSLIKLQSTTIAKDDESAKPRRRICLIGPSVSDPSKRDINQLWEIIELNELMETPSNSMEQLKMLNRPELKISLSKLAVWKLKNVSKAIFMDADMLPLKCIDELFLQPELSAVPDAGWPDIFNSGLFVCEPNEKTYDELIKYLENHGTFDGGDQGLLNDYFSSKNHKAWNRLSFLYNVTFSGVYTYSPAFQHFRKDIKVVHFLGSVKPWSVNQFYSDQSPVCFGIQNSEQQEFIGLWWKSFKELFSKTASYFPGMLINVPSRMNSGFDQKLVFGNQSQVKNNTNGSFSDSFNKARMTSHQMENAEFANYRVKWNPQIEKYLHNRKLTTEINNTNTNNQHQQQRGNFVALPFISGGGSASSLSKLSLKPGAIARMTEALKYTSISTDQPRKQSSDAEFYENENISGSEYDEDEEEYVSVGGYSPKKSHYSPAVFALNNPKDSDNDLSGKEGESEEDEFFSSCEFASSSSVVTS